MFNKIRNPVISIVTIIDEANEMLQKVNTTMLTNKFMYLYRYIFGLYLYVLIIIRLKL